MSRMLRTHALTRTEAAVEDSTDFGGLWFSMACGIISPFPRERLMHAMSYTLQLPPAVVSDAKVYASSCGTTLSHLVKMYIIELSTRKPEMKKRKLGIADG